MANYLAVTAPTKALSLSPQSLPEAMQFAEALAKSTIIPREYQGKAGNVLVAMLQGMELGLGPLQALQGIAVINGKATLWGDALLAVVQGSGLLEVFAEHQTDTEAVCTVKRKGMAERTVTFTAADAKKAGLWGKGGPWTQYPKRMMQMRARSFALRDTFADVMRGIRMAEEERDILIADGVTVQSLPMAPDEPLALNPAPAMTADQDKLIKDMVRDLKRPETMVSTEVRDRYGVGYRSLTESQAEDYAQYLSGLCAELLPPHPDSLLGKQEADKAAKMSAEYAASQAGAA